VRTGGGKRLDPEQQREWLELRDSATAALCAGRWACASGCFLPLTRPKCSASGSPGGRSSGTEGSAPRALSKLGGERCALMSTLRNSGRPLSGCGIRANWSRRFELAKCRSGDRCWTSFLADSRKSKFRHFPLDVLLAATARDSSCSPNQQCIGAILAGGAM